MISGGQENKKGLGGNGGSSEVFRGITKRDATCSVQVLNL